jgi:GT2 family glycosyltransferase
MLVSIVVPSYRTENRSSLVGAVDSLLRQSYANIEILVVVHTSEGLHQDIVRAYDGRARLKVLFERRSLRASAARNIGIRVAQGDVLAFLDDDAVADQKWVENLVDSYQELKAMAVGGKILPLWIPAKPAYFPDELYWLVGATHKDFAEDAVVEVRNVFASNMSFRKEVFAQVGLFNESLGFGNQGKSCLQGDEAEFGLRMTSKLGKRVVYNPQAVVYHRTPVSKAMIGPLLKRAFYQGYSKALLRRLTSHPDAIGVEKSYLRHLALERIPQRIGTLFTGTRRTAEAKQLLVLVSCVVAVGLGFIYGYVRRAQ